MSLQKTDTIENAREKFIGRVGTAAPEIERVPLDAASGRVLAKDVYAEGDSPSFERAIVDGYAVRAADTVKSAGSDGVSLTLRGSVRIGKAPEFALASGECAYVPTGAMIPDGADAMVMVEDTSAAEGRVALRVAVAVDFGIAHRAEDMKKGQLLLSRGTLLRPCDIGALAANGQAEVFVFAPLRLSIISTGDELVGVRDTPTRAEVRDINTSALSALAGENGYRVVSACVLRDEASVIQNAVLAALEKSDVVIVSGGSSMGEHDLTARVFKEITGEEAIVHGIAVKPGKPTIISHCKKTHTILIGLPGHPVSALMTFTLILSWYYRRVTGQQEALPTPARLSRDTQGTPGRTTLHAVALSIEGNRAIAEPVSGKSGMITTMTRADGFIIIPPQAVPAFAFDEQKAIRSHDIPPPQLLEGTDVLVYRY
ncbi:MAG: molybdopterin molybdotransferase MoeA [Spirochaetaceae bacterium]|jgi:molybdopterin molybdotransferase|nr:molybdopterin molybdotransferase MoeA [Spirochaetaceae bacterium]